jgi:hypothetical protein
MKFNQYAWNLYRESASGRKALQYFTTLTSDFVDEDFRTYTANVLPEFLEEFEQHSLTVDITELVRNTIARNPSLLQANADHCFAELYNESIPLQLTDRKGEQQVLVAFGEDDADWYDYVAAVSLGLHQVLPELFLPYNFRSRFHHLEEIHREFSIPLPPVPGKQQQLERAAYYLDINETWQEFRKIYGLSPIEMCAFLYDFAPNFVTLINASDLPEPTKVWMITGTTGDIAIAESATPDTVRHWGANANVRRGDILLLYLVSPLSAIHSVWRACSPGFVDPFFHYHSAAWMCAPVKTGNITLKELREHPLWSQKPAVRANFKGPSGKSPVSSEEYDALLKILTEKGQDVSNFPKLPVLPRVEFTDVASERDVEVQIVEPFFMRLGYAEKDWIRQFPVRMGRGERNYPDYAFGAVAKRGEETARMIVESKYQLSSRREFVEAFLQAKSYALRLECELMALVAREGIWVFPRRGGILEIEGFIHKPWGVLERTDDFREVAELIGREEVLGRQ